MFDKKAHWENIYRDRSPLDVSWYQKEPTQSLGLIRSTQIASDEPIIDVGGGASILVDYLSREGYSSISVLDISEKALACAKERLGAHAQKVEWYESDITRFKSPHQFSLWHDRAVFHFLTIEADRKSYVEVLNNSLRPGGHLIIAAFAVGGPEKCSGLDIVQYDAPKLMAQLGEDYELVDESNEVHFTPSKKKQKFVYFRFIRMPDPSR